MFEESSNRIELSRLVQDLLNFGVLGSLLVSGWGWIVGGGGWLGVPPPKHAHARTHTHMHACPCTCVKHDNFMQMAAPIGGIPGNSLWCHTRMCVHARACVHMCVHMCGGTLSPPPTPIHPAPPPPGGDPWNQSKFNSTWTNRDISIPFEDLKSVETSPPMGGCIVWWVGCWWVGSGQNTKNLKIVDWIKIIQFCLKIYDL